MRTELVLQAQSIYWASAFTQVQSIGFCLTILVQSFKKKKNPKCGESREVARKNETFNYAARHFCAVRLYTYAGATVLRKQAEGEVPWRVHDLSRSSKDRNWQKESSIAKHGQ